MWIGTDRSGRRWGILRMISLFRGPRVRAARPSHSSWLLRFESHHSFDASPNRIFVIAITARARAGVYTQPIDRRPEPDRAPRRYTGKPRIQWRFAMKRLAILSFIIGLLSVPIQAQGTHALYRVLSSTTGDDVHQLSSTTGDDVHQLGSLEPCREEFGRTADDLA